MALYINGTNFPEQGTAVKANGADIKTVSCNGATVWNYVPQAHIYSEFTMGNGATKLITGNINGTYRVYAGATVTVSTGSSEFLAATTESFSGAGTYRAQMSFKGTTLSNTVTVTRVNDMSWNLKIDTTCNGVYAGSSITVKIYSVY